MSGVSKTLAVEVESEGAGASAVVRASSLQRTWPWAAAVLSGLLLILCFPRFYQGWLVWIALTPVICAVWLGPQGNRRAVLLGYVTGIVFIAGTFHWLSTLAGLFKTPLLVTIPLLLGLYMGLYVAFWTWFIGYLRRRWSNYSSSWQNLAVGALGACAWVTGEWIRGWLLGGFGWNGLGVALHQSLAMIQIADVVGIYGLTWLVAFTNLMAVNIVARIVREFGPEFLKRIRWEFSMTMAMIAGVFAYGVRAILAPAGGTTVPVKIAAVQPNIPQHEKWNRTLEDENMRKLGQLTDVAAAFAPDLLLWPEAATPRGMFADQESYNFVVEQAEKGKFALLIGSVDADQVTGEDFNVAAMVTEEGARHEVYRKMHLVPFGEYLPLRKSFPLFAMIAGDLVPSDFTTGKEYTVFQLKEPAVRVSALICFEDTVGNLTRRFVLNGADLLVNITNDGWFAETEAAEQHLANAIFRAVETRRALVRCGNTGVTCGVDSLGRVNRWIEPFQEGATSTAVAVRTGGPMTFYARHGDLAAQWSTALTGATLASWGLAAGTRRRRSVR